MLDHIKRIIDSCETYDQAQVCLSFVNWPRPGIGPVEKQQILGWIQAKVFKIRNQDLEFHRQEMAKLKQDRTKLFSGDNP